MKAALFCAPGELSMSLLMKCGETWGWKESFKIKFPLQLGLWVLFFLIVFERNIQVQSQVSCGIPQNGCGYQFTIFCA